MAIYEINGKVVELPDEIKGDALTKALGSIASEPKPTAPTAAPTPSTPTTIARHSTGGAKVAADVNNPSGIRVNDKFVEFATPEEGVQDSFRRVSNYIAGQGYMKNVAPTPNNIVGMWVLGDPKRGQEVMKGKYLQSVNDELTQSGIVLNADGTVPNTPEAAAAVNRAIIKNESGSKNAGKFLSVDPNYAIVAPTVGVTPVPKRNSSPTLSSLVTGQANTYMPFANVRTDVDQASLNSDPDFIRASRVLYENEERKPWNGSDADLADWGKNYYAGTEYNLLLQGKEALDLKNSSDEAKKAYVYMMDTYENTNLSWSGAGRAVKYGIWDPFNIASVASLGTGFIAKKAATTAARIGFKEALKRSIGRTGVVAAVDTAIMSGASDAISQNVRIDAGAQDEFSYGELGASVATGAAGGLVLGTTADLAGTQILKGVRKYFPKKEIPTVPEKTTSTNAPKQTIEGEPKLTPKEEPKVASKASEVPTNQSGDIPLKTKGDTPDPEVKLKESEGIPGRVEGETPKIDPLTTSPVRAAGKEIADQLQAMDTPTLTKTIEEIRQTVNGNDEGYSVISGLVQLNDRMVTELVSLKRKLLEDPNAASPEMTKKIELLEERQAVVEKAKSEFGTEAGTTLQLFRGSAVSKVESVEQLMAKTGKTQEEAEKIWLKELDKAEQADAIQAIKDPFDVRIEEALASNNFSKAAGIAAEKQQAVAKAIAEADQSGVMQKALGGVETVFRKAIELAISSVFTFKTVVMNLAYPALHAVVRPALRVIVTNPLERARWGELTASYSAMSSTMLSNLNMAWLAGRYESPILTNESFLGNSLLSIKGLKGGVIRFFPRILQASDELLTQVNYKGFVAGRAAYDAYLKGAEQGKTGKDLKAFVESEIDKALDDSIKIPDNIAEAAKPVIDKGINLGLTGDKLVAWVEKQIKNNPEILERSANVEVKDLVNDMLFKRQFSGEGVLSSMAQKYEEFTNIHPSLKFISGQLFFRTPIRLVEMGVRLTPGVNLVSPTMRADLLGKNGTERFIRAQSEMRMAIGIAAAGLSLFAKGSLTGDRGYGDYRERKSTRESSSEINYGIKDDKGNWNPYGLADPVALPLKIIANTLERVNRLDIRRAQGEFIDKSEYEKAVAHISVAVTGMWYAVRDMNLLQGFSSLDDMRQILNDPENHDRLTLKFFSDKLGLYVPNTMRKLAQQNDPRIKDPATFWQVIESRLSPVGFTSDEIKTSFSYDLLGNQRKPYEAGSLWNAFPSYTPEEMAKGRTPDQLYVQQELDRLTKETGAVYLPTPYKHPELGNLDLRTVLTSDKSMTLYDRWNQLYKEMRPEDQLRPILEAPLPDGTFETKGYRNDAINEVIRGMREDAFYQLFGEEPDIQERLINESMAKEQRKAGFFDFNKPQ